MCAGPSDESDVDISTYSFGNGCRNDIVIMALPRLPLPYIDISSNKIISLLVKAYNATGTPWPTDTPTRLVLPTGGAPPESPDALANIVTVSEVRL